MGNLSSKLVLVAVSAVLMLSGCTDKLRAKFDPENNDHIDSSLDLSRDDYRHMTRPEAKRVNKAELLPPPPPPLPSLKQILSAPKPPKISETQLVSIAVTDDVPLKDVLLELARLAEVDIELDAGIEGGISFIANNKPFNTVVDRIATMAALRYEMKDGVLRIERDLAYIENYPLDFLNVSRSSSSDVNISTNVLSAGDGGGAGLNTGSTQTINSTTESDFWESLESGIEQILNHTPASKVAAVSLFSVQGNDLAVQSGGSSEATGGAAGDGQAQEAGGAFFVLNKQAGVLTVSASEYQHELVERFIQRVRKNSSSQVLIEAKIVEVSLSDKFQSGVEWSTISDKIGLATNFNAVDFTNGGFTATLPDKLIPDLSGDVDGAGADLNDFIQLVEGFGTTRTLSSPRLHAINNQQAVLTFAENFVYFEINVERETDTTTGTNQELLTVDSQVKTVPIGIILTLQPSINTDTGEITLMVRPTLSRVTNFVSDPAVAYLSSLGGSSANIENEIPVVEVRELDSILKLKSGQVMIVGGLMENSSRNTDTGVPGVSSVPWLGNLFKSVDKDDSKRELIIFIRATLVGADGYVGEADKRIYEKFSDDNRPLKF